MRMRPAVMTVVVAALTALTSPAAASVEWADFAAPGGEKISFIDALTAITDKASRDLFSKPVDRDAMRTSIHEMAWKTLVRMEPGGSREAAKALRQVIFVERQFIPDTDFSARAEAETAVMSSVLEHRRGVCLSLSLLYLAVAEEAALPLSGVSVPTHFFVRYDRDGERLNFETLDRGGSARSDDFYRQQFFVRDGEPFYLLNLTPRESLASYLSQLAAIYIRAQRSSEAIELLEVAAKASPRDPEIRTNLGIGFKQLGRLDEAVAAWRSAIILDPYDDVAHYRLSSELADRADWLTAIYHFDEALRLGHAIDIALLRRLEPHRPDAIAKVSK